MDTLEFVEYVSEHYRLRDKRVFKSFDRKGVFSNVVATSKLNWHEVEVCDLLDSLFEGMDGLIDDMVRCNEVGGEIEVSVPSTKVLSPEKMHHLCRRIVDVQPVLSKNKDDVPIVVYQFRTNIKFQKDITNPKMEEELANI